MKRVYFILGIAGVFATGTLVYVLNKKPSLPGVEFPTESLSASGSDNINVPVDSRWPSNSLNPLAKDTGPQTPKEEKINTFLAHSRLADEFHFLDEQMLAQETQLQGDSPSDRAALEEIRTKLSSEALMDGYKTALEENFSEVELERLNEIYSNPMIERLKAEEAYNRTPEGLKELAAHAESFNPKSVAPEKLSAIQEYIKASGSAENMDKVFASVETMMDDGSPKKNNKEMMRFQNEMRENVRQALVAVGAKMFDGQSPDQIRNTASLLGDPVAQRENALKTEFMVKAMKDAIGTKLKDALSSPNADS